MTGTRSWLLGAAYDRIFGKNQLYPIIGLNWRPRESLAFRFAYPESRVRYDSGRRQSVELRLFPSGHKWHVRTDDFRDEFDYEARSWRTQLTWSLRLTEQLMLDLGGGYDFDRKHSFEDDSGGLVSGKVSNEWFLNVGFRAGRGRAAYGHGTGF